MALLAIRGESCTRVVRVRGAVEVLLMTTDAVSRCTLVFPAHMASYTVQTGMRPGQREARQAVIEFGPLPGVHSRMALLAVRRKSQSSMVGRRRIHVAAHVATNTISRQAFKTSDGGILVARIAFDQ